ncbi:uncharacterized protein [Pocillopora verrucosa]|uniref:uncharacterized protein n=1 Tax=Pocillopora verrucosa TaxID=203993 RepID=UPI00333EF1AB
MWKLTGQNIAGSFFESRNSKSVSQRWQHSIERDADLHVDIGCLKKRKIFYDREFAANAVAQMNTKQLADRNREHATQAATRRRNVQWHFCHIKPWEHVNNV